MTSEQPLVSKNGRSRDEGLEPCVETLLRHINLSETAWRYGGGRRTLIAAVEIDNDTKGSPMQGTDLTTYPIHLGLGAGAEVEPAFTGSIDWYADYMSRHQNDGVDARLVGMHRFGKSWDTWEMHPHGSEVVLCIAGSMTLHQDSPDGGTQTIRLRPGQYAINPPGTWHTADVEGEATAVFITAGLGTEHRPR